MSHFWRCGSDWSNRPQLMLLCPTNHRPPNPSCKKSGSAAGRLWSSSRPSSNKGALASTEKTLSLTYDFVFKRWFRLTVGDKTPRPSSEVTSQRTCQSARTVSGPIRDFLCKSVYYVVLTFIKAPIATAIAPLRIGSVHLFVCLLVCLSVAKMHI